MPISRFDLNLFVVFDTIYSQQSLTKAAEVLHVTQPAISSALARLRERFDDPLFVRTPAGMSPTPLARSLIEPVRAALGTLDDCISARLDFDPASAHQTFRLHATEVAEVTLLPSLAEALQGTSPESNLEVFSGSRKEVPLALASGDLHAAVDTPLLNQRDLMSTPLRDDHYVCVMRRAHPLLDRLDLDGFLACPQIHISSRTRGGGHIDLALRSIGQRRRVALRLQHYTALPELLQRSDLIAAAPKSLADTWPLAQAPLPFETPRLELLLFWHKSVDSDPANRWFRQVICEVMMGAA
ncbi:LysR family transcriptional regulator [Spongiibacter taiwanensis]|uniref:LysR family transcriptional regulator n=1 Tax=Spongiibacter taiwanensis TaxID=1748242 RepID=UPI002034EF21|nr:LysR family transcriptional regulator [Spongiibacter taiwanensis]USA42856.1 LysR family transcriptional regulator [Spongiibacter taiwanensis]